MRNFTKHTPKRMGRKLSAITTWILLIAMLVQSLSIGCLAAFSEIGSLIGGSSLSGGLNGSSSGVGIFNSDETIAQLKKDFLSSINKNLIQEVSALKLTGKVGVIISFSDNSLITAYASSEQAKTMSYEEFRETSTARRLKKELTGNRDAVLAKLEARSLISEVKYTYNHLLDGAFVTTTYEQLEEISRINGVERIIISDTYLPAEAVENPVDVYEDTGIFDSSDVKYTGKGTIVAILDSGCDYTHTAFTTHEVVDPLYDRDDIAGLLADTLAYSYNEGLEAREVYYGNITNGKIAYGYDYADKDPDIMPFSSSHGTHVAGIIGGDDNVITGVALDTQFAIMKVFGDYAQGGEDGDILAALEDSVILGVDAINMSLGSSCGFSREVDNEYKNEIYDNIEKAGISLIVAASNDYSSAFGSEAGNTNKTDNPDSATVGAPSTFSAALSVASINGNKDKYMLANGTREVFFHESVNLSAKEYNFFEMLGITDGQPKEYEYVTIPGFGMAINYSGIDVKGKIALVKRGDISFEEKVQFAYEAGAAAVIVYNNVFGDIAMTIGNEAKIPAVSIGKDDGDILAAQESGTLLFDLDNLAGPFMSDFSSWGPNPDLTLKPEITAHGGNILSSIAGGGYEKLSGTSMATPNMCGIVVLIRQYVKEKYPELTAPQVRDLVNQLCMSTATIALDRHGNAYSPRKQGAGIADIAKATTTLAYLYVDGIGKTKLELGDDPSRTGVYTMTINLKNLSTGEVSYRLGNITMTESISTSDPEYVAEMGYLLSNAADYRVENGSFSNGILSVEAGKTAKITVTLTLSDADKSYLNANFKNGMYVEGFLTFDNTDENGVDLNAPFLAFYGDWGEAPIFDLDYYEVETEAHNNAIDPDDKIKADYYATTPTGNYYYDYILPLGSYLYNMDESEYTPIPATAEHASVSYYADCISGIYGVFTGLLRGAKELNISIVDTATGKVVWSETQYNCYKAHYNGAPYPYVALMQIPMADAKTGEVFGYNNAKYEVTMSAKLDWNGESRNSSDTYSFSFYIDYQAPTVTNATFYTEYDKSKKENRYYVDVMVYDNHYAMSLRPIIAYEYTDEKGELTKTYSTLSNDPIPVYQENRGEATKVTVEITDYIDLIGQSAMPEGITFYVDDYALNANICYVPFPGTEDADLEFMTPTMDMNKNQTFDLTTYLTKKDSADPIDADFLKNLTWTSSDENVIAIHNGKIEAKNPGSATVSVTGSAWYREETVNGATVQIPISKTIVINVSENEVDDPNSSAKVQIESLDFSSYYTLFAFSSDIDFSSIGATGSTHYFGNSASISCYPSEQVQLFYSLNPWNLDPTRYTLKWTSSNPKAATVDENGVVTAVAEGRSRITLQITIDGKTSLLAARCTVEVKSEFIIEGRTLVAYKGWGGDVEIPGDEGITSIGAFAFSHYDLDNQKEVEKDEHGGYDIDEKKEPLGNKTLTSIKIPEGIETIEKYAFYNCELLSEVILPTTCTTINEFAFAKSDMLVKVNFENVKLISNGAFMYCESLTGDDTGHADLSLANVIGDYAFYGTRIKSANLTNLSRSGVGAFMDCSKLESVELGTKTRVSQSMFENTPLKKIVIYSDTIGDAAFRNCSKLESVELRGDLTYIGEEAFSSCKKLSSVTFAGICEQIGIYAFGECTALKEITLPNCDVILGDGVFSSSGLKTLIFAENTILKGNGVALLEGITSLTVKLPENSRYKLVEGVLYYTNEQGELTDLVLALPGVTLGDFVVPASMVRICDAAFSANKTLTSVTFAAGSKLESIGYGAFSYCPILKSVTLPDRNVTIGTVAFYEANMLKTINLEKVTYVGDFAFQNTALTNVNLTSDRVVLGFAAFYGCHKLETATLGAAATIGQYAFCDTTLVAVNILGNGATVGEGAFMGNTKLTTFSFDKLTGTIGALAFYACTKLTTVDIPNVTELGEGSFADCYKLTTFRAEKLEIIGNNVFAPYSEDAQSGATFTEIYAPNLRVVGDNAFYGCIYLTKIDLSKVTAIGETAFAMCFSLESVQLSAQLEELRDFTFYGCSALKQINLDQVRRFGAGVFYGAALPAHLELTKAEYIGDQAFIEDAESGANYIKSVNAPNLTYLGSQAFGACKLLTTFTAPKLEVLGIGAFALTSIEEFVISPALREVGFSVFEGTPTMKSYYAINEKGEKVKDYEYENVMIRDGVLYTVEELGYVLVSYPPAKDDVTEFEVAPGTVRVEYCAVLANNSLTKVILPETLRTIGNYGFYQCENLKTVVFKSYYAPVLEGTMTDDIQITPDNRADYPGFDKLYKYDYYYRTQGIVAVPFTYSNFVALVATTGASDLTYIIPENCEGYDSPLYVAYFKPSEENSGVTIGKFAKAFIEAASKLPEIVDRFDKKLVDAAINAYNALEAHADELSLVDDALISRFLEARKQYNVSVAENKIAHLFDMDRSEYSFEQVKDAREFFLSLSDEERALVYNAAVLDEKIEELTVAMGMTPDFDKSFNQHYPETNEPVVTPPTNGEEPKEPVINTELLLLIALSVVFLAVGAAWIIVSIKHKKKLNRISEQEAEEPSNDASEQAAEESNLFSQDNILSAAIIAVGTLVIVVHNIFNKRIDK